MESTAHPRKPYPFKVGDQVRAMWLEPGMGTVLGDAVVTSVQQRKNSSRYELRCKPASSKRDPGEELVFFTSSTGRSEYVFKPKSGSNGTRGQR